MSDHDYLFASSQCRECGRCIMSAQYFGPLCDQHGRDCSLRDTAASMPAIIDYTNHRGERSTRTIRPLRWYWGTSQWHREPQYLMDAWDVAKGEMRTFALASLHSWREEREQSAQQELAIQRHRTLAELVAATAPYEVVGLMAGSHEMAQAITRIGELETVLAKQTALVATLRKALAETRSGSMVTRYGTPPRRE